MGSGACVHALDAELQSTSDPLFTYMQPERRTRSALRQSWKIPPSRESASITAVRIRVLGRLLWRFFVFTLRPVLEC